MADYAKKKNDELAALCKERGLAHTGKKADLVKRLEDHDKSNTAPPTTSAEDEIDWDDEPATETAKAATSAPAANAIAAGGLGQVNNPQEVPNQQAAIDPAQTSDLAVAAEPKQTDGTATQAVSGDGNETAAAAPAPVEEKDFSTGLADRTLQDEIERRKARARKFGMPEDSDEIKNLERALRFGTTDLPGLLNKALPAKQDHKRGREAGSNPDADGGIRKRGRGGGAGPGRRQPRSGGAGGGDRSAKSSRPGGYPGWMSEKDRKAAEQRKNRYEATAAS